MSYYRIPSIDLSTRIEVASQMLLPIGQRRWGYATEQANALGVSRQWLYKLRRRVSTAIEEAVLPQKAGRRTKTNTLIVDSPFIDYATTVLSLVRGSVRGIQDGLSLLFGIDRSVGAICQTLQAAGEAAAAENQSVLLPLPVLAEADEIFQGNHPCLTVVDGRSFAALNLSAAKKRDAITWGVTFLDLKQQGIEFLDVASDGARGITSGIKEADLGVPVRLDWFHLLREATQVTARLERRAHRAILAADKARRAQLEAIAQPRRRGRPVVVKAPVAELFLAEHLAIETHDLFVWLVSEVRAALEPIDSNGQLTSVSRAKATVATAAELMQCLPDQKVRQFAKKLSHHLLELIAPLQWLTEQLAEIRHQLDAETEATILWAWRHRKRLALRAGEGFGAALKPIAIAFWEALTLFHRTSSLAESFHSWLRPYLVMHRGMPQWLLSLLEMYWNHHTFGRGQRAGKSPLELAGVEDAPSLKEALTDLFPKATAEQGG